MSLNNSFNFFFESLKRYMILLPTQSAGNSTLYCVVAGNSLSGAGMAQC